MDATGPISRKFWEKFDGIFLDRSSIWRNFRDGMMMMASLRRGSRLGADLTENWRGEGKRLLPKSPMKCEAMMAKWERTKRWPKSHVDGVESKGKVHGDKWIEMALGRPKGFGLRLEVSRTHRVRIDEIFGENLTVTWPLISRNFSFEIVANRSALTLAYLTDPGTIPDALIWRNFLNFRL